jgi:peptidoglycan/xylan/chitin deacetylase (PgdA/CDA1 family)
MAGLEEVPGSLARSRKLGTSILGRALSSSIGNSLMTLLERMEVRRPNLFQVLTYHRIKNLAAFEQQMRYLATNFNVISMAELLAACQGARMLPARTVMITFDDAYKNFAQCAWPVLRRHRLPVTLFVPTAYPDHADRLFWWDRLEHGLSHTPRRDSLETPAGRFPLGTASERSRAYLRLRDYVKSLPHTIALAWTDEICGALGATEPEHGVLGWDALRQLAHQGVTLGAHTQTHPLLNRVPMEEAQDEAVGSLRDLRREIGDVLPVLAYPDGRVTDDIVKALEAAGFALAFTTVRGTNDVRTADRLRLRRINVGERAALPVLRARLLQATPYLNQWRPLAGSS